MAKKHIEQNPPINNSDFLFYHFKKINYSPKKHFIVFKNHFTHRSLNKTNNNGEPLNYERLEFLGDAILGSVIAAFLYQNAPKGDEGYLTQMRSKIVNRSHLNSIGKNCIS